TLWRTVRGPAAILLVIIAAGVVIALVRGGNTGGTLDPRSVTPDGSRALARLLQAQGVRISLGQNTSEGDTAPPRGPATPPITHPERLRPERVVALRAQAADLVLIAPSGETAGALGLPIDGENPVEDRAPGCALPAASAAGVATLGGLRFIGSTVDSCYD